DLIAYGGLPRGRSTLLSGTAGSPTTLFGCWFLAEGIRRAGQPGVFVTSEETPEAIRTNMKGFGWDIPGWEAEGQWAFVDVSPSPDPQPVVSGPFDLGALLVRVESAVRRTGARRVSLDSLTGVFTQLGAARALRHELFRVVSGLQGLGVTSAVTAERTDEYGPV